MNELTPEQRNDYAGEVRKNAAESLPRIARIMNDIAIEVARPNWPPGQGRYFRKQYLHSSNGVDVDITIAITIPGGEEERLQSILLIPTGDSDEEGIGES